MKMCSAKETVKAMLDHMTNQTSFTSMSFGDTRDVAVLINNLGSVTNLEMGIYLGYSHTNVSYDHIYAFHSD